MGNSETNGPLAMGNNFRRFDFSDLWDSEIFYKNSKSKFDFTVWNCFKFYQFVVWMFFFLFKLMLPNAPKFYNLEKKIRKNCVWVFRKYMYKNTCIKFKKSDLWDWWATPFMWDQWATVRPMINTFSKSTCVAHWSHPLYITFLCQAKFI